MTRASLREIARQYIGIIDAMEKTRDKLELISLEEKRIIWHNRFIEKLRKDGVPYRDREDVTRIAYKLAGEEL